MLVNILHVLLFQHADFLKIDIILVDYVEINKN